ncbi:MAG TPA: adenylyl-sulfate kinase [Kofleriaceae bacterium]
MKGCVVWLTGLPASGKSTLAIDTSRELETLGVHSVTLDGDAVRAALVPPPGYDPHGRDAFYDTLARLAALIAAQRTIVLVPATAHLHRYRDHARSLAPSFIEVFVDTPLVECQRRDPKGLYSGDHADLPGQGIEYEPPDQPDLLVRPDTQHAARQLSHLIVERTHDEHPVPSEELLIRTRERSLL